MWETLLGAGITSVFLLTSILFWWAGTGFFIGAAWTLEDVGKTLFVAILAIFSPIIVIEWVITPFLLIPVTSFAFATYAAISNNGVPGEKARQRWFYGLVGWGISWVLLFMAFLTGFALFVNILDRLF